MGSTLETSIIFSLALLLLSFLIVAPIDLCSNSLDMANYGNWEIKEQLKDEQIINHVRAGKKSTVSTSPERLNTFLVGISENYRLIYGSIAGE